MTTNVLDVTAAPYNAGPTQTSTFNRDAIAQAIADAAPGATILIPEALTVAPGTNAYIYSTKPLSFIGVGWASKILPDPNITSSLPVLYILGTPSSILFHGAIRDLQIGDSNIGLRQGGPAIRLEANQGGAGLENWELSNLFLMDGVVPMGGNPPVGIYLLHSNVGDPGAIYNLTVRQCQIRGGITGTAIADSIRIRDCLIYGAGGIDIDIKPSEGNFTFNGNNVSCAGGFRLRSGVAPCIMNNVFTQQLPGTEPYNALIDLDGDISQIVGAYLAGNRIHKEHDWQAPGNPPPPPVPILTRLLRINNVADVTLIGNDFSNPRDDTPIEVTASCPGVFNVGPNSWQIISPNKWVLDNPATPVHTF
jgi:hypothetical protein